MLIRRQLKIRIIFPPRSLPKGLASVRDGLYLLDFGGSGESLIQDKTWAKEAWCSSSLESKVIIGA